MAIPLKRSISYSHTDMDLYYDHMLRMLLVGDCTGKTSILKRFTTGEFSDAYRSTVAVDFEICTVDIDQQKVKLQVWDTSSKSRYSTITRAHFRRVDGIIVVYDITSKESFKNVNKWMKETEDYAKPDVLTMIVGNKSDLERSRVITRDKGQAIADAYGAMFSEVSAKSGDNIDDVFVGLIHEIRKENLMYKK